MSQIIAIVGRGRVGSALAAALAAAGEHVAGPLGRGEPVPPGSAVAVVAVPDAAIEAAANDIPPGPVIGHCSASVPLAALGEREAFTMHPLLAISSSQTSFAGAGCAISGSSPRAIAAARRLAGLLQMRVAVVRDEDRALYHAAASLAANYLVALEGEAERLMSAVGVSREMLAPLVRSAANAWAERGAAAALTGPIARGDLETVQRQREAIAERAPELLPVWDALAARTEALAAAAGAA